MNILMLSSSKAGDEPYLASASRMIMAHLNGIQELLFVPYAGVTVDWDTYTQKVQDALPDLKVKGLHQFEHPQEAILSAKAIAVGGGNTFQLLNTLYQLSLVELLSHKVQGGLPYIGWSAGSNICGNSIRTTNDMPIVEPASFAGLNLVPFQINPHYTDYQPPGHNGETRDQRIAEFCALNPSMPVIAIREGTALRRSGTTLTLLGDLPGVIFLGEQRFNVTPESDLSEYL